MTLADYKEKYLEHLQEAYTMQEINSAFNMVANKYIEQNSSLTEKEPLSEKQKKIFESALERLKNNEPVEYIVGEANFYGRTFFVNADVHVPRPETETLVEWVLEDFRNPSVTGTKLLDIGTGSGILPITFAKEIPGLLVTAMDFSKKALQIARENAGRMEASVEFLNTDLFQLDTLPEPYDIIVSNPPYILKEAQRDVQRKFLRYEPPEALYVEDGDAMKFNRKIAELAQKGLKKNGAVYVEINQYLKSDSEKVFRDFGFTTKCRNDIFGNTRTLKAFRE